MTAMGLFRRDKKRAPIEPTLEVDRKLLFATPPDPVIAEVSDESDWIWRPILLLTLAVIFFTLLISGLRQYVAWLDQPVQRVQVDGNTRHIDKQLVARQLAAGLNQPILELDLSALHERLIADPWVSDVQISRQWPPALRVELVEEVPVARWGDHGLLNPEGDIFWPELKPEYQGLPRLSGPSHETLRIMQQFHELNSLFQPHGLRLKGLELESRGAWNLELDNGLQVIAGREDLMQRLKRFIRVYESQLAARISEVERVDIRYTNGVAVRWKADRDPQSNVKKG